MHPHVVEACVSLQRRIARMQGYNQWLTDQAEEALTELVNNPDRSSPPAHLIRNALANASKKLKRRSELGEAFLPTMSFGSDRAAYSTTTENIIDVGRVLDSIQVGPRALLERAADGADAEEIADELGLPAQRVRERLSRARAEARKFWMGALS
ncbi:DNA-directed RNA polymerase specialized sigma24 family protein [Acidovorax delafieldii]|uniref:DNA-directed RNA polymerase specialized sigma24 family protein n=1 Tax=Acidovorax delafieldii TaxID=47920 RepID=A0AAJ2BUS5_ACIDE|nr:hypothetical protein [Acidovorax delafieldii]MDR6766490.1 DNA-directed RNA polymerase specialized sigma24 family protein [Acidovorax delafieldii]MDR6836572.1 DNA-directed RNA polymerase specialized sigma24 family protein [Acidovorax delafieldii]MDR7366063.1 DNA-directed RNA polymerase specialized sigma24 family protein [Acidovorax delafieldii]